eukprot:10712214-Alexandrium_andersonii.AAC.1
MSASLVGSEMCIRDSRRAPLEAVLARVRLALSPRFLSCCCSLFRAETGGWAQGSGWRTASKCQLGWPADSAELNA